MKRIGAIVSLIILTVMLSGISVFAGTLELVETSPKADSHSATVTNVMIKLKFSENIASEKAQKANADAFILKDPKGKKIGITPYYNGERYPKQIGLLVTETLTPNTQYTLTIDEKLQSSEGDTLTEPIVFTFGTRDISKDGTINMIMMAVMFGGMIGFSVWDTRRKLKKENEQEKAAEDGKVNPYKEAKKTGKSVEEIVAKTEKEKQKQRAKEAKRVSSVKEKEEAKPVREGVMRVSGKKPISAAGGKTPASVIAKRQAREKEAARKKAAKQNPAQKSKGSKQQQKKKKN